MTSEEVHDSVTTIRLKQRKQHPSVTFSDTQSQSPSTESLSTSDLADLDIDALDAEFQRLTHEYQNNMRKLREDPSNASKKQAVLGTKQRMNQIKLWTSKLNTEDGRRLLEENEKEIDKRKYEIDQVLKVIKAQSNVDVCFIMDCTGSMKPYIAAAKNTINSLTKTITALFRATPLLAFIGYRDIDYKENNLVRFDFTSDVDAFREFLSHVTITGGADYCEDVIGKRKYSFYYYSLKNIHSSAKI